VEQEFHNVGRGNGSAGGSQAVERAARLLVHVLEAGHELAVGELTRASGLPKSTTSRLLAALEREGLVEREGARGKVRPGPVIMRFAHSDKLRGTLTELARDALAVLAEQSGETINLAVPTPAGVEHLAQIDSPHIIGAGQWVGRRVDYHCTAVGKVFLAYGAAELPDGPLARPAPRTIVSRERLEIALERVRLQGYATASDELEPGLASVAAPVRALSGEVVAALALSGPVFRLTPQRIDELRPVLIEQTNRLAERLGYRPDEEGAA
jgi:IclR family transcriptional regulator, acetate operon repressor